METDNTIKILLVDDEVKFLKAVSDRLSIKGFDVTTADNGDAAIDAANKGGFDVAVVDLQMPGTDGAQVLKILKENHQFIEIIMLTGHATVDSAVECTKL
ncbi:MAG: response regulator, partial [Desulfobacteraceae bacterium]|nr:response regulator [Desulfobacteraceae bacterium]